MEFKKIKLLEDVPVGKEHNMVKDRVLEVVKYDGDVWVQGKNELVKLHSREFEVVKDEA